MAAKPRSAHDLPAAVLRQVTTLPAAEKVVGDSHVIEDLAYGLIDNIKDIKSLSQEVLHDLILRIGDRWFRSGG